MLRLMLNWLIKIEHFIHLAALLPCFPTSVAVRRVDMDRVRGMERLCLTQKGVFCSVSVLGLRVGMNTAQNVCQKKSCCLSIFRLC